MLRLLLGQMRTCPPRARMSEATDCPAESWEPLDTLMPVPASKAEPCAPSSAENSSPSVRGDWVWVQAQDEKTTVHANNNFRFRLRRLGIKGLGIKATESASGLGLVQKFVFLNGHRYALFAACLIDPYDPAAAVDANRIGQGDLGW